MDVEVLGRPGPPGDQRLLAARLALVVAGVGLGLGDLRHRLVARGPQVGRVQLGDQVALADGRLLLHGQLDDAAGGLGADDHLGARVGDHAALRQ